MAKKNKIILRDKPVLLEEGFKLTDKEKEARKRVIEMLYNKFIVQGTC